MAAASRPEPATSVVVSTYDEKRWEDLSACLRSIGGQSLEPLETIVVVDHNPPLLERVGASFADAKVVANTGARGLAGARNSGIDVANGEVVAFIDDDARAEPGWLERLQASFEDAAIVGAGGALIPSWRGRAPGWFPAEFLWVVGCSYTGLPEGRAPIRNPIGANMAVRAEILREIGGFREGGDDDAPREIRSRGVVRAGGNVPDDTDLAIRVKQHRPEAIWLYEPEARVLHSVTAERATPRYFVHRCYEEGIGKAALSRYVGSEDGLSSERNYAAKVLPRGVLTGLREALRGNREGALRAAAIAIGTLVTATGFLVGSLRARSSGRG